jgi:septal ring factor EnvC (AmiA/AmiB activator)
VRGAAILAVVTLVTLTLVVTGAGVSAQDGGQASLVAQRQRLLSAKQGAAAAQARADALSRQAKAERNAADRARADEAALAARVDAAAADLAAATARVALTDRLLAEQRGRLGQAQAPAARLLAALTSLARRPTVVALAQPGSVDDLVHARAVLGSALPVIRVRTAGVRAELARTRTLRADAALASRALFTGRARLERERTALATLEAQHRGRATVLGRGALSESDRAVALGEQARDLIDRLGEEGEARATAAGLAALPGPLPRPLGPTAVLPRAPAGVYRLPVEGRLVTGFDELSPAGVRSRGLTFSVKPRAGVIAPAAGIVRYAGRFRDYGVIVIIDHGGGWTTLVTGLATSAVKVGQQVGAGVPLGRAGDGRSGGDDPRITAELRRKGEPFDLAALVG